MSGNSDFSSARDLDRSFLSRKDTAFARDSLVSAAEARTEIWISSGTRIPRVRLPVWFWWVRLRCTTAELENLRRRRRRFDRRLWFYCDSGG